MCFFFMDWGLFFFSRQEEDEQERFERLQELELPAGPESASFYKAKMKRDQRVSSAGPSSCPCLPGCCTNSAPNSKLLETFFPLCLM